MVTGQASNGVQDSGLSLFMMIFDQSANVLSCRLLGAFNARSLGGNWVLESLRVSRFNILEPPWCEVAGVDLSTLTRKRLQALGRFFAVRFRGLFMWSAPLCGGNATTIVPKRHIVNKIGNKIVDNVACFVLAL